MSGALESASATFVSGPSVTSTMPGCASNRRDDRIHRVAWLGGARRRRIAVIAQAVLSVEPFGVRVLAPERARRTAIDRHVRAAKLGHVERVSGGLLHRHVPGHRGDGAHANIRERASAMIKRDGIVRRGVGVDQEVSRARLQRIISEPMAQVRYEAL